MKKIKNLIFTVIMFGSMLSAAEQAGGLAEAGR